MKIRNPRSPITFFALRLPSFAASLVLCATVSPAGQSAQPRTIEDIINTQISYPSPSSINTGADNGSARDTINNLYNTGTFPASTSDRQNYTAAAVSASDPRVLAAAPSSPLVLPCSLAFDQSGNLYVADTGANVIWKITTNGKTFVFAGSMAGKAGAVDAIGTLARFSGPQDIACQNGELYVADGVNNAIRAITLDGNVTTLAGALGQSGAISKARDQAPFSTGQWRSRLTHPATYMLLMQPTT